MAAPLRVGWSATLTCGPAARDLPDGIGVYTRAMAAAYARRVDVVPVPVVMGARAARGFPAGAAVPPAVLPYGAAMATAASWATGAPFRGARALADRIDVYHATDYRIPRLARTPVCATIYDAIPQSHPEWANPRFRAIKNLTLRRTVPWADRVFAISQAMVPELVEHYRIDPQRITVTPLGVDARWFEAESAARVAAVQARYALRPGYLLFVGTLQPRKNVARIVAAFARLAPGVVAGRQLVIVGRAGWRAGGLVAMLRGASAASGVRWLDYVDDASDLRALYQGAAGFVFPSLYEGFGLPVLEAFASGVPVVTSRTTSLPEVAGDAALLVDPTDIDALAAAMASLLEDARLAARLRAAGLARARAFTWEKCAAATVDAFRALL